jgi:hypothetical protein
VQSLVELNIIEMHGNGVKMLNMRIYLKIDNSL